MINNLPTSIAHHRPPIRLVLDLAADVQRLAERTRHRDGILQSLLRRDSSGPAQSVQRLRIVLENRGVHSSVQKLNPLALKEWKRADLRACVHGEFQPALPPALLDHPVHLIHGGTDGDPMSGRCAEERSQVKRQPVITDTDDHVVLALQSERLVPHVFQQTAGPHHGDRGPLGARCAQAWVARNRVQPDARGHHAACRSHHTDLVPACHQNRSEIEQVCFDAAGFAGPDGAHGRRDDQNAARAQAFLLSGFFVETSGASSAQGFQMYCFRIFPQPLGNRRPRGNWLRHFCKHK